MSHPQSPVSQLLARSANLFAVPRLLIAGQVDDDYPRTLLRQSADSTWFLTDYSRFRQQATAQHGDLDIRFGHQLELGAAPWEGLLLYLPKAKAEAQFLLAQLTPLLAPGASIWLAGDNRGGINGAEKLLAPYCSTVRKQDSARRCSLYQGLLDQPVTPFTLDAWFGEYTLDLEEHTLRIQALPGVFSAAELDEGSRLLLEHLPPLRGRVLDLGCGAGVIGAVLKLRHPDIRLELADINALALASAKRTLAVNGLAGDVYPSDGYSDVPAGLQHIVTNPPFHAGLNTHYQATEQMMLQAPSLLAKGGELLLVANAFLRYPPFLDQAFGPHGWQILAQTNKFKLYLAR